MKRILVLLITLGMLLAVSCSSAPVQTQADATPAPPEASSTLAPEVPASSSKPPVSIPQSTTAPTTAPVSTAAPIVPTGFTSPLTGLPVSQELSTSRPIAVMINNHKASMPQIGIGKADVIYEAIAEGGITRLLALYLDYSSVGTIGSIRSSRDYYLDLAQIHDAIYIHAGGSEIAYSQIKSRKINNLDGVRTTVSGVFWRDAERRQTMAYEHTLVTSGANIQSGITKMKYRTQYNNKFQSSYRFNESPVALNGTKADYIKIPNSSSYVAEFYFDQQTSLYKKNQFGKAHVDGATGQQLSFTNVLILFTEQKTIDDYGRNEVDLTGKGSGYYCSSGECIPITWSRSNRDGGITLSREDGSALLLNPGKSYVSIASTKIQSKTVIQ